MLRTGRKQGPIPTLLLCALLIGAHFVTALHAVGHDKAAPQGKVCSTCVTAAQLGAACVYHENPLEFAPADGTPEFFCLTDFRSAHTMAVRQRGPPALL